MKKQQPKPAVLYCQVPITKNTLKEFRVFKAKAEDEDYCDNCGKHRLQHTNLSVK